MKNVRSGNKAESVPILCRDCLATGGSNWWSGGELRHVKMKMKQMKLDGALKLYTVDILYHIKITYIVLLQVLYFFAFLFTFMMSVPMLKHVMPESKCLLFVQVQIIVTPLAINRQPTSTV